MTARDVTLSVVSHGQNVLVNQLLEDVQRHCADRVTLVLTENIPDPTPLAVGALSCPVTRIANKRVKGFGANHNAAFTHCRTPYYCVVNPDIRLPADPFSTLVSNFTDKRVAIAGPLVRNPAGAVEDSARRFPTLSILLGKVFGRNAGADYPTDKGPVTVDWVAGMFLLFRAEAFHSAEGFDERYFMYYEDVDIGRRFGKAGLKVVYDPRCEVMHDARRGSRKNPWLARYHLLSVLRFLGSR